MDDYMNIGLGSSWGWSDLVGPQTDGTQGTPVTAQQVNSPANTAGYSDVLSPQVFSLLQQGIGVAANSFNLSQVLDYKRYEATNGGLFMNGQGAYGARTGVVNPNYSMLILLMMGAIFIMKN